MEKIDAVYAMQDYINQNLNKEITMADLARVSLYSPWYSYRIFKEQTSYTPAEYIRRLIMTKSAIKLRDTNIKIIDIAYECNYDSVDGFQRAFFKEFGVNPYEYAKHPIPITLFTPFKKYIKKGATKMNKDVSNVFITVVTKPAHKVVLKRGVKATDYWGYCEEVGCDVWGILKSMKSLCGEPVCLWLPEKYIKTNTSKYVQGVEVSNDYDGEIPSGFDIIELPEATYLMFNGEPFKEEDFEQAITNVWEAIRKYNPNCIGYNWDNKNPRIQLEPIGTRGYIELMPVTKL